MTTVSNLSHALSVTPDGAALSIWLTKNGFKAARFSLESGWSEATLLYPHEIETESSWLSSESPSPSSAPLIANQYPMQLRRLADGRLLLVWAEYDSLVTVTHADFATRDATAQSLWALVTDGTTATAQRAFGQ